MSMYEISIGDVSYKVSLPHASTDYIQGKLASTGEPYELPMLQDMASRLKPDGLVLDIGANIGNHTLYLANVAKCFVHAFEPNSALCEGLQESIAANNLQRRITLHQVGVSDAAGFASFDHLDKSNLGAQSLAVQDSRANGPIELIRLDDLEFEQPVSMIKVDVEGMELEVLRGAVSLLRADRPVLYVEASKLQDFEALCSYLSNAGYMYCKTYNATPTHCFIHETAFGGPMDLADLLQEKARIIYSNKDKLEQISEVSNKARKSLSESNEKYRDACVKVGFLQKKLDSADREFARLKKEYDEIFGNYRKANAKYRDVCAKYSALKTSKTYRASLHVKSASTSVTDAVKLPVRLWRLKRAKAQRTSRRLMVYGKLRQLKWKVVIPVLTRLGVPYSKLAHLTLQSPKLNTLSSKSAAILDKKASVFTPPSSAAQEISILGWPDLPNNGKPYVMGVMDEFTTGCFEQEVNLIQPRPDNWYALAEKYQPVLIFIESAWKGNYGSWQYRVADYTNKPGHEVAQICQYAREKGIPTLFWNKEDPVHHEKFMCTAKLVDHIFTTDADMKASYEAKTGNSKVYALPFAAQPALHKPAPLTGRKQSSCFAGSWYGNRHAERGEAMRWLLQAANRHGLEIYDRNHGTGVFPFPEEYQAGIKGSLPYKELCDEYSRYRVFLNVNSVTESPTMFSRRVFELMASGTPVVSTYAKGIETLFESDAVWMVRSQQEADEAIRTLMTDDTEWRRRSLAGIREVFTKHTYAHRLNDVFGKMDIHHRIPLDPGILLVAEADSREEFDILNQFCLEQDYHKFRLGVVCARRVAAAVNSLSDRLMILQQGTQAAWITEQQQEYPLAGWIVCRAAYGKYYLRDLVNATLYEPTASGWAKSTDVDRFAYGQPARLCGTLWKTKEFIDQYIGSSPQTIVMHEQLFVADSDQFQQEELMQRVDKAK